MFALGGEDDLVRLVARAKALQAVLQTPDGASLLAGYRRGANIVRIEEGKEPGVSDGEVDPALLTSPPRSALNAALDAAVPAANAAVAAEDFTQAMTALARLRPAVDAFFEHVTVNAHEAEVRRNRLALLARLRTAVHSVADFSKIKNETLPSLSVTLVFETLALDLPVMATAPAANDTPISSTASAAGRPTATRG